MSEKFSEYADLKQLLLERFVGEFQRQVEARAITLRESRFGVHGGNGRPIVYTGDKARPYFHSDEAGFKEAVAKSLAEHDESIHLAALRVIAFFKEDEPKGKVRLACSAYERVLNSL